LSQLRALVSDQSFAAYETATSHTARVLYYRTLSLYYYTSLEHQKFYETGVKLIALQESQPHYLRENLSDYIAALSNHFIACGLLKKYEDARLCLIKIRDLQPITEDDRRKIHRQYFGSFFILSCFMGEFEAARHEVERCQREAARFDPHQYETASFYFQYVLISLGCDDHAAALQYLNQWLAQPRSVSREDLQSLARILSLIIHYELGNFLVVDSQLRAAVRFLKRKNRLHELERRFMHGMSELIKMPDHRSRRDIFGRMKAELDAKAEEPETKAILQTFDLGAWLEARWRGQMFASIVREKYQRELAGAPKEEPVE
jgi:hypothetical protein